MSVQSDVSAGNNTSHGLLADFAAEAQRMLLARAQTLRHIEVECTEVIDDVVETLAPQGPYAYTAAPETIGGDALFRQKFATTREEIRQCYEQLATQAALRALPPITEIVTSWYVFYHALATTEVAGTDGQMADVEAVVVFPNMGGVGITGELFWARRAFPELTGGEQHADTPAARVRMLTDDDRRLEALRREDAAAFAAEMTPEVQFGLGDIRGTQEYVGLHSADEVRRYFEQIFAEFHVESIDVLQRHVADWYVFNETLWTLSAREEGARHSFRAFQFCDLDGAGKVVAQIGYCTPSW